jgi:hypothetical protein
MVRRWVAVVVAAGILSACGARDREPQLLNIRSNTTTPDEFAILPTKPLEAPEDYAALPEPTPGGTNRVDPTPIADAVATLGGNPAALARSGVPAADGALFAQATRFGVQPSIRADLAAADLEYRRANDGRVLERVFNVNVYFRAYEALSLDQYAELERWRLLGVRTPSAPPDPEVDY